jgi:hypothetical protein
MSITVQHCPLCSSSQSLPFDQRTFRGQPVANRLCRACGLVYQSPRMSDAELEAFYAESYRQLYQGSQGPDAKDLAWRGRRGTAGICRGIPADLATWILAAPVCSCSSVASIAASPRIEPGDAYRPMLRQPPKSSASLVELRASNPVPFDLVSWRYWAYRHRLIT